MAIHPTKIILIFLLLTTSLSRLWSQNTDTILNRASQYTLGAKDEILISINIWGFVQKPGQYLVPRHTDLISLISFAGGPREGAKLTEVRIIRGRQESGSANGKNGYSPETKTILKIDVARYLETGRTDIVPTLESGDTVLIGQSFGNKFSRFVGVTSVVGLIAATATLLIAFERLSR